MKKKQKDLTDFVVCGGFAESHELKKEVNFSDTIFVGDEVCRIPGNKSSKWSLINAHGWFSYNVKVNPKKDTLVSFVLGSLTDTLNIQIAIGDKTYSINQTIDGKKVYTFTHPANGES